MAAIVTMRKTLPWPFNLFPPLEWSYEWLRDALMTLLSLKGPIPHGAEIQTSEHVTRQPDGTVESVKESTASGPTTSQPEKNQTSEPRVPVT